MAGGERDIETAFFRQTHYLLANVRSGTRLAIFRKTVPDDFVYSPDQLVSLVALDLLILLLGDWVDSLPAPAFNGYAFTEFGFNVAALLLAAFVAGKLLACERTVLRLSIILFSIGPFFHVLWLLLDAAGPGLFSDSTYSDPIVYWLYTGWLLAVVLRAVSILSGGISPRAVAGFTSLMLFWFVPGGIFGSGTGFWYESDQGREDRYAAYRQLDAEAMFYSQPRLMEAVLGGLLPQRPGIEDIYFIGFAGDAMEDVFSKEVHYARALFDARFDTRGRSMELINHLSSHETEPLATATNLGLALEGVGAIIDREEDIVVLYLTSHGSMEHEVSVNFWPLPLNDVSPRLLGEYLDAGHIKWRVIMVSACYSGGFIEPLKSPETLLITAAAPDRASFGCSNENEFTYFGEALLKGQLQDLHSFSDAFEGANRAISLREGRENREPSEPQLFVGHAIGEKLRSLETGLSARTCADNGLTGC
jgi:hypothetical protein